LPRLVVLLPCYNEQQALQELLGALSQQRAALQPYWELSVIVVDDGSADRTAAIADYWDDGMFVDVVRHSQNRGLGAALDTGIDAFLAETQEHLDAVLAVMDADGTHPPRLLSEMLSKIEGEQLDVVIASRFAPGGGEHGLSALRKLYTRLAGAAMRTLAPILGVRDYSCGYRVYRRVAIERAIARFGRPLVTELGFVCMVELLVKLARSGARVGEVGLDLHYELKQGASKMNVAATIRRYAAFALRARFDSRLR
jgi:dolichol-phosphate mannosyltransferase